MSSLVWNRIKYKETYVEASECLILVEILKNLERIGISNGLKSGLPILRETNGSFCLTHYLTIADSVTRLDFKFERNL